MIDSKKETQAMLIGFGVACMIGVCIVSIYFLSRPAVEAEIVKDEVPEVQYTIPDPCGLGAVECAGEPKRRGGEASWYARGLKNPYAFTAASTEFERGTRLLVTDPGTKKSVEVVINDYGPNADAYPERIIDLSMGAFAELAPLGLGIIFVEIEEIK